MSCPSVGMARSGTTRAAGSVRALRAKVAVTQSRLAEIAAELDGAAPQEAVALRIERGELAEKITATRQEIAEAEATEDPRQLELPFEDPEADAVAVLTALRDRVIRLASGASVARAFLVDADVAFLDLVLRRCERHGAPAGADVDEVLDQIIAIDRRWSE